jgi:adenosylcobinamide-GDP ribazoletransferase
MKRYLKGFYMALGMFWAVPLPFQIWDDTCMNLMMPCFPLVGALIGALWWGFAQLLTLFGVNLTLASGLTAVFPFLITGFLHLDGFMDTCDAVLSGRPLEDKLRILKDPHTGAFAVISAITLFVMWFASCYACAENPESLIMLLFISVTSRCCSAFAILSCKAMPQSGYANMFRAGMRISHKIFIAVTAAGAAALSFALAGVMGAVTVSAVILGYAAALAYAYRQFKGISGDLAGFSMVTGELCGLLACAVIYGGK